MVKTDHSKLTLSQEIIGELNSGYNESGVNGPSKTILGVNLNFAEDTDSAELKGYLLIDAYQESPWGDSANTQRSFEVTSDLLKEVTIRATNFQERLKIISEEFSERARIHADAHKHQFAAAVKAFSSGHRHKIVGPGVAKFKSRY
ncbi:MAG: hypothetical protein PSY14_06395 [bacterium]|nr:hypothetical protein [bacterium]